MKPIALILTASLFLPVAADAGDVLLLDAITNEPINSPEGLPRPNRGMSMDQVRSKYGTPDQELPWVGDPPISRWIYPAYTVYFEHQYVLTAVVHR